jgi:hypothetical protein
MATSPAIATDLSNRSLRTLTAQEIAVGTVLLGDSWNIITSARPSVNTRLDAVPLDTIFHSLVVQIQVAMVLRVLTNPDGKLEEASDDYRYRLDAARSTGALYLSDAELALISAGDDVSDGSFTIRPAGWRSSTQPDTWYTVTSAGI